MATIPLTKGYVTIVDEIDVPYLSQWKWQAQVNRLSYVRAGRIQRLIPGAGANGPRANVGLHRAVYEHAFGPIPPGLDIDHINGDPLDNRRQNLRVATRGQNLYNKGARTAHHSRFKGVDFHRQSGTWRSRIRANGRQFCLGYHKTQDAAAVAYDVAALKLHGEFARLNFPRQS